MARTLSILAFLLLIVVNAATTTLSTPATENPNLDEGNQVNTENTTPTPSEQDSSTSAGGIQSSATSTVTSTVSSQSSSDSITSQTSPTSVTESTATTTSTASPKNCDELSPPDNGTINSTSISANSTVTYSCYSGYRLEGNNTQTCLANGHLSGTKPACIVMNCDKPQHPAHGKANFSEVNVNATVSYSCNEGYHLKTNVIRTCKEVSTTENKGYWEGSDAECVLNDCGPPGSPKHGKTKVNITTVNSTATFSCNPGYSLIGEEYSTCTANKSWSPALPTCSLTEVEYGKHCIHTIEDNPCATKNATCHPEEDLCLCSLGMFHYTSNGNDSCLHKVQFNEKCEDQASSEQCLTPNASCIENVCACDSTRQYWHNETCALRPPLPAKPPSIINSSLDTLTVFWDGICDTCTVLVEIEPHNKYGTSEFRSVEPRNTVFVSNLKSGTLYNMTVTLDRNGITNEYSESLTRYTSPKELSTRERSIGNVTANSITVYIHPNENNQCENYLIDINPPLKNVNSSQVIPWNKSRSFSAPFSSLNASTKYTIKISVQAGNSFNNDTEDLVIYTKPREITKAELLDRQDSSLKIEVMYEGGNKESIAYSVNFSTSSKVTLPEPHCGKETENLKLFNNSVFNVTGLNPGIKYTFTVFSCLNDTSSDSPYKFSYYTKPQTPSGLSIVDQTETELKVNWKVKFNNSEEHLILDITPKPTSDTSLLPFEINITDTTSGEKTFSDLQAGTEYTVSAYTRIELDISNGNTTIHSENITATFFTRPAIPNVNITQQNETSVNLTASSTSFFNELHVIVNNSINNAVTISGNKGAVTGLEMGTAYNLTIFSMINGLKSSTPVFKPTFTRPGPPTAPIFSEIHETKLLINWTKPESGNVDQYRLTLSNGNISKVNFVNAPQTSYSYQNLTAGKLYMINITTIWRNLTCQENVSIQTYTLPTPPSNGQVVAVGWKNLTINIIDTKSNEYLIEYSSSMENNIFNKTVNGFLATIDELHEGTLYDINIYSIIQGDVYSERSVNISSYTRPGDVQHIRTDVLSSSSLQIKWDAQQIGHYDMFNINATCESPNGDTDMNPSFLNNESTTSTILSPLDPGTFCNISVVSVIYNVGNNEQLLGNVVGQSLNLSTKETAPEQVSLENYVTNKSAITFSWKRPINPNGIIRKYKTLVIDDRKNCTKAVSVFTRNITGCNDADKCGCKGKEVQGPAFCDISMKRQPYDLAFEQTTSDLHPYRNYTVVIQAFTNCWGEEVRQQQQTKIDRPSEHKFIITRTTLTKSSIELTWDPLDPLEEGNGKITKYTVNKTFIESSCQDVQQDIEPNKTDTSLNTSIKLNNLRPYWNYNLTISASTDAGEGPPFYLGTYTTDQSLPGKIDKHLIKNGTNTASAWFSWDPPCSTNGEITKYSFEIYNNDTKTKQSTKPDFNGTSATIHCLDPYSNYTIAIRAFTEIGPGQYSEPMSFQTQIDTPRKPSDINAMSTSKSSELRVTWKIPEKYTGPTKYTVKAVDVETEEEVSICLTGYNFKAADCLVQKLDAYWNYTVYVIAETIKGTNESQHVSGTTAQSVPGNVTQVILKPEEDVTKPRSLIVSWQPPVKRDLNGILTNYYIRYSKIGENVVHSEGTSSSVHSFVITDIQPGKYNVEVFAATIGNGSRVTQKTVVPAGAPLKLIEETESNLLMQPSEEKPSDDERQIVVKLPLKDLLCNIRSGPLTRWGVIVSQESQASDKPFFGSVADFKRKVRDTYKNWFQVKDMDSIPPYIATPTNWSVQCLTLYGGNRRKRATTTTEHDYKDFVVGSDGKCSGIQNNDYCNGELQPGRSYRVKSFVCTSRGCTETEYSKPISTAPDLTIPIAAGISSALVVLAVLFVVIFVLRRRQLACFAKDDESMRTHTPGEGIHMDRIESTKKNNAFRPGPIKLSDFPDEVEKMHRDSDLIFADAYKLIKEKSPNHPMTASEQQCCRPKNRYTNILPFDHSRVKLRPSDDMEGSDYINANYIPGYTSRREYIATQGAMQATFDDFWRMIWEQNVDTIVMLTKLMEKGRHKCDKYWPDLGEPVFYGDLVVSLQSESNLSDYTIKIFEVKMGIKTKKIKHFHFLQWPDFGCPDKHWPVINFISMVRQYRPPFPKGPLLVHCREERRLVRHFSYLKWPDMGSPETPELLLEFVKAVRQYTNKEKKASSGPTVVHCSAGVGRTGTFIAVDYLLQHIRDHDEVDIFSLVLEMRNHRLNMVQTEDQYIYIHECVKAFITTDEEDEEDEDEHVYVNTSFGAAEENIYENSGYEKD